MVILFELDGCDCNCPHCGVWLRAVDEFAYPDTPCGVGSCPSCGTELYAQYDEEDESYFVEINKSK